MSNLSILQNKSVKVSTVHLLQSINDIRLKNGEKEIRSNDFIARVADELEGEDYETFVVENSNKTKTTYFMISIEQAKLVAMRESKAVRKVIRDKLNELESKNKLSLPDFSNPVEAARAWADAKEAEQKALAQIEASKPALLVYEALANRRMDCNTTTLAKQLGTTATKLNIFLKSTGIKFKHQDLPMSNYSDWFNVVTGVAKNGYETIQCLITPLGQIEIAKLWSEK